MDCFGMNSKISFITGIWDLDRNKSKPGWQRSFDHYIDNFIRLLSEMHSYNLIIFIDRSLEELVWRYRDRSNTRVYYHSKDQFSESFFPFFNKVQEIRNDPKWYNQAGWLKDSTQGCLEYYNPMVMSKMFLLHNAKCYDPFNSEYFYWIDGGITNTLNLDYFKDLTVIENLINLSDEFLFICFPYETECEIHGFEISAMKRYAKSETVNRVARGGFFGGHKNSISSANDLYYSLLSNSLSEGLMGTEESIFTLMTYLDPDKYKFRMIESNGLIYRFFEDLKQKNIIVKKEQTTNIYINTFNSPEQLMMVLKSFERYEPKLLKSNIILINNTTKNSLFSEYDEISNSII